MEAGSNPACCGASHEARTIPRMLDVGLVRTHALAVLPAVGAQDSRIRDTPRFPLAHLSSRSGGATRKQEGPVWGLVGVSVKQLHLITTR